MRATRSDCTSQEPRRAVRITRLLFEIPICAFVTGGSSEIRRKIFRKSTKMEPKSMENRCKIDFGRFGHSKPFQRRTGTRSEQIQDAKKRPQDRSWSIRGGPGAPWNRPKASPGRSWDSPGRLWSDPRARLVHRALSNALAERLCIV